MSQNDNPVYLIDSNILIQAHRRYYPFDVVPGFWKRFAELAHTGIVKSIDKVKLEVVDNCGDGDLLKDWCIANLPNDFFLDTSIALQAYVKITSWATSSSNAYTVRAMEKFLATDYADSWLTSMALLDNNFIIVTEEISAPNIKREVKIPEVCDAFDLKYLNTIAFLRELKVSI